MATGALRWAVDLTSPINSAAAAIAGGVLVGTESGRVTQLTTGGQTGWSWTAQGRVDATPLILGELVLVASTDGTLSALDLATGVWQGEISLGGPLLSSPRTDGAAVFVGSYDNSLYRVLAAVGTP